MTEKRVICAVMLCGQRVLLARRASGQKHAGYWEFPGGKAEPGETDAQCLSREIREEFGVSGTVGAHVCDSPCVYPELSLQILLCAYLFTPDSQNFSLQVHDKAQYFSADELANLTLTAADLPIAQAVKARFLG